MYNILVCDDEKDIVAALKIYLESEGYGVIEAFNGREALDRLRENEVHLVLMDIMMPVMDGLSAMAALRRVSNVPVILLTAKGEDTDKVLGLNVGADDYITKPFNVVEMLARVRSQLRRYMQLGGGMGAASGVLEIGGICLDDKRKKVAVDGDEVYLTPTEYDILRLLMQNADQVFSPREIYQRVWQDEPYGAESTVAVHIRHLREKVEINPAEPRYIKAVWGQGYKFDGTAGRRKQ
ncbi:MAG: response regulator transcription factor [Eubacteriales bacterium]|nr:response regulator transcription factor [Eubacteriales bacterium]